MREAVTPQRVVDLLNELIEIDREWMVAMFSHRPQCNQEVADHPEIQVAQYNPNVKVFNAGVLGLLNGLFGAFGEEGPNKGYGCLSMVIDSDTEEVQFQVTDAAGRVVWPKIALGSDCEIPELPGYRGPPADENPQT